MLVRSARRAIAAFASLILVVGFISLLTSPSQAATQGTIIGKITNLEGEGISVSIRAWRATGNPDRPWEEEYDSAYSSDGYDDPEPAGTFTYRLNPGTYKLSFNVSYTGQPAENDWVSKFHPEASTIDAGADVVVEAGTTQTINAQLPFAHGSVSGRVTDADGKPLSYVEVETLVADQDSEGYLESIRTVRTDNNGEYTARGLGVPMRLRFSQVNGGYVPHYYKDTTDWDSAETFNPPVGEDLVGKDAVLNWADVENQSVPFITGSLTAGSTLKTTGGDWLPAAVSKKYQWYRSSGSSKKAISRATKSSYKLTNSDLGRKITVRVIASKTGVKSATSYSRASATIKRRSKISLSGSSPKRATIKLSAKVRASGVKATGRVTFRCSWGLVSATETVTLKSQKASASLSIIPKGRHTCTATYKGTSKVASVSKSKRITVK